MNRPRSRTILGAVLLLSGAAHAQQSPAPPDTLRDPVVFAGRHRQALIVAAAEQMNDADYAFRPTPDTRTFAQLIGHIIDYNYLFCAQAKSERPPVTGTEKTKTDRAELRQALSDSYAYCESAAKDLTPERAQRMVKFGSTVMSAESMLQVATMHNLHMYGNIVVYMRLRGRVPPSSQPSVLNR